MLRAGTHVAHGKASNAFQPFMLPGDMKGGLEGLKAKLLVNFNLLGCFVGDVEKEFSGTMKLWYASLGGNAIGPAWKRSKKREREEAERENNNIPRRRVKNHW